MLDDVACAFFPLPARAIAPIAVPTPRFLRNLPLDEGWFSALLLGDGLIAFARFLYESLAVGILATLRLFLFVTLWGLVLFFNFFTSFFM
jgi:hypothetical protein